MSRGQVLILDDHLLMRDTLKALLTREGFLVTTCASGKAGLDLTRETNFSVFLIDYQLPDMNGDEVVSALRSLCPGAIIVGFSIASREQVFLRAGADKFIDKGHLDEKLVQYLNERIP